MMTLVNQSCGTQPTSTSANAAGNGAGAAGNGTAQQPASVSFSSSSSASRNKPQDRDDYSGQPCVYFTRPAVEEVGDVVRHNTYAEGAKACYKDSLYVCKAGRWKLLRDCPATAGSDKLKAENIESGAD